MGKTSVIVFSVIFIIIMSGIQNSYAIILDADNPISITGNDQLLSTVTIMEWDGDGSEDDPIIIRDLTISTSTGHAIFMEETDLFVEIRNNTLISSNDNGLYLNNVENVVITNNSITDSDLGIYLLHSSSIQIWENYLYSNSDGIKIENSFHNRIEHNNISRDYISSNRGIYLINSNHTLIHNNSVSQHSTAIDLLDSHNTYLRTNLMKLNYFTFYSIQSDNIELSNNIIYLGYYGPNIYWSSHLLMEGNNISRMLSDGAHLSGVFNITITGNSFSNNNASGILISSDDVIFENNDVFNNTETGVFSSSDNFSMRYNNISSNNIGVDITYADNVLIHSNTISNNTEAGIDIDHGYNTTISDNSVFDNADDAIIVDSSDLNHIHHNNLHNNSLVEPIGYGMSIYQSNHNTIHHNYISHNYAGVALWSSNHSLIYNNSVYYNDFGLLFYSKAYNNTAIYNTAIGNQYGIFMEGYDNNVTLNLVVNSTEYNLYQQGYDRYNHISSNTFIRLNDQAHNSDNTTEVINNYYSDHITPDNDSDGLVDNPYLLDGDNSTDLYPVTSPYYNLDLIPAVPDYFAPVLVSLNSSTTLLDNVPYTFVWSVTDDNSGEYELYLNSQMIEQSTWIDGITVDLTFEVGVHNLTMVVYDLYYNWAVDTLILNITDITVPVITALFFEISENHLLIVGSIDENNPSHWALEINGSMVLEDSIRSNSFTISHDYPFENKIYVFNFFVFDTSGNFANSTAIIKVDITSSETQVITAGNTSSSIETTEEAFIYYPHLSLFAVLILLRRRKPG